MSEWLRAGLDGVGCVVTPLPGSPRGKFDMFQSRTERVCDPTSCLMIFCLNAQCVGMRLLKSTSNGDSTAKDGISAIRSIAAVSNPIIPVPIALAKMQGTNSK